VALRIHGAFQLLAKPTGRRIAGKWVGFGKDHDVNTGPWSLEFLDASQVSDLTVWLRKRFAHDRPVAARSPVAPTTGLMFWSLPAASGGGDAVRLDLGDPRSVWVLV
jgi:hypothetical protein